MTERVVAMLGKGVVPADTALLRADDLGVLRGDGVFETMHVRGGQPWLLDQHLARMADSAAKLELALPARRDLLRLVADTCAGWPAGQEGALRLVCTRGPEPMPGTGPASGPVTTFTTLNPVGAAMRAARRAGITIATVTLGINAGVRESSPWLLGGVKSLSYAVNLACQRWASSRGLDDVLWLSTDGFALEAPTASLVWQAGDTLCTVPPAATGILPGITARWLLDQAGTVGLRSAERMVRRAELMAASGVWLTSSVRGLAPVRELDGVRLAGSARTAELRELLGYPA